MTFPHKIGFMKPKGLAYSAAYTLVYNSFTNKPSAADITIQSTMLDALVAGGYYAKAELLDVFSAHSNTAGESQKNWRNPGTFDPTLVNAPTWTQYAGFTGASTGTKYVRLNFIPSVNGTLIGQNNICIMWGVGNNIDESRYDVGGASATIALVGLSRTGNKFRSFCNDLTSKDNANTNSIAHYALSRGVSTGYDKHINLVKTAITQASVGSVTVELHACGYNFNGVATPCNRQLRYVFVFSYLTDAEVKAVIAIMETYLDNYTTGLY